jgi:putative nucleotidyltransferase with HDIG domain
MKVLVTGIERDTAKNNNEYFKVNVRTEEKKPGLFFLWDEIDKFEAALRNGRTFDMVVEEGQFAKIKSWTPIQAAPENFVDTSFPSDEYANKLLDSLMGHITKPVLKNLIETIFGDEKRRQMFITWPAAKGHHHAIKGGLLKHTFEVMSYVSKISADTNINQNLNRDALLTGALLHDIGKLADYTFDGYQIGGTFALVSDSHLASGAELVARYAERIDDPDIQHVMHIIRSHHGWIDGWGSVVKPATPEAFLVFQGDYFSMIQDKRKAVEFDANGIGTSKAFRDTFLDFEIAYPPVETEE